MLRRGPGKYMGLSYGKGHRTHFSAGGPSSSEDEHNSMKLEIWSKQIWRGTGRVSRFTLQEIRRDDHERASFAALQDVLVEETGWPQLGHTYDGNC